MHLSSYNIVLKFRNMVVKHFQNEKIKLLDVGSYGVNGTYRDIFSDTNKFVYVGLDLQPGPNVDYIPQNPYSWPELENESFDVIISGQAFEHIEFPWLIIEEMKKKLKRNGLICIVAPSRGPEHKYPVDCWRYYPDGFRALAKWTGLKVLEAKTCWDKSGFSDGSDQWGDSFCILLNDEKNSPDTNAEHCKIKIQRNVNKNNPLESGKTASYYSFARDEIIAAIETNGLPAKRILEIGCAAGATGKKIKEKMSVDYYVGVEICEQAAGIARQNLDMVIVADIEKTNLGDCGVKYADFDLLLALDVLEHLYNPWDVLAGLKKFLKPGGYVIASIPNIQNISIVNSLIHGRWRYESAGILDATHVRFFTMEEIERLFSGAEFSITKTDYILNPSIDLSNIKDTGNSLSHENINLTGLSREDFLRLFVYQYIIIAKSDPALFACKKSTPIKDQSPSPSLQKKVSSNISEEIRPQILFEDKEPVRGLVSIVILTFNQLKYTKECIESIWRYSPEPHQIIFVDNGSTDGTVKWLRQITEKNSNYRLIKNRKNCGFAQGCNQGIRASSGEYILLLNNDVVVTEGWLSGMLACLNNAPAAGIVGPMTNNISGPQRVANANYRSMHRLHEYARSFGEINRHRRIPFRRIVGFCMLFRRKLAERIGLLDESFGSGNFEDDDFSLRAALEGYRNFIAGDVFIHHYGSRSFIGNSIDYRTTMSGNKRVFTDKWSGIPSDSALGKRLIIRSAIENAKEMNQKGEVDKAVKKLIEGIGQSPESEEIYHVLAGVLIEAKRFEDALEALHSIPDSAKEDIKTLELLGYCKEGMGLSEEAQRYAEQVLSMNPTRASALNLKGILGYNLGEEKTAENFFTKAIKSDPGYGQPHKNLGMLRWAQDKKQEGRELLERGFILSPTVMDIANSYHAAITETKELSCAEGLFKDAMAIYPLNQRISYLFIDILLQQGKYDAAMQEIEEAMVRFGIDDGILSAAIEVRKKIGPKEIDKANKGKGTLSLSMIVKNEEQNIAKCLMSIKPIIDEMIVVDTGSTDRTKNIARALGAKVYDFAWSDDFSGARNYSLSKASGDWILVLDADEVISPLDHAPLLEITKKKNHSAYSLITRNYTIQTGSQGWSENDGKYPREEAGIGWYPSSKVRLFKNDERIRFENRVHEFVEGTLQKTGLAIKSSSIPVHHYGRLDLEKVTSKGEAYYQLGKKKLKENGDNAKALYELAVQAGELKKYEEAVDLWRKFIYLNPHKPLAHFNLGFAYMELGKYEEARTASKKAIEFSPKLKGAAINYAHCELYIGDVKKAISLLEDVLRNAPGFPSAMAALSAAYFIDKQKSKGFEIIEKLRKKSFDCAPFLHEISKGLFSSGRYEQALSLLEAVVESKNITDETRALVENCRAVFGIVH